MTHIKQFENFENEIPKPKGRKLMGMSREELKRKDRKENLKNDVYSIMTKELSDRKRNSGQKLLSMKNDAYHIKYDGMEELDELERKYPVGGTYNGQTIVQTTTFNSKRLED